MPANNDVQSKLRQISSVGATLVVLEMSSLETIEKSVL